MTGSPETFLLRDAAAAQGIDADALRIRRVDVPTREVLVSSLWYSGPDGASAAAPELLLLHGGGQNAHTWDITMAALGRPAVALDLPGHGGSGHYADGRYAMDRLSASVAEAVDALGLRPRLVVGMSLGGMIALGALDQIGIGADQGSRRGAELVLVDVSPNSAIPPGSQVRAIRSLPEGTLDELVGQVLALSSPAVEAKLKHSIWHATRPTEGERRVWRADPALSVGAFVSLWPELERQAAAGRVRAVLAEHGSFVPKADRARLRRDLGGDRVEMIDGSVHSIQGSRPAALATVLARLLDALR